MSKVKKFTIQSWPFLLGAVLGYYFIVLSITGTDFSYFPGDLGDARFNAYILEHSHKFISGQLDSFWDAPFMYPAPQIITFSDNLLGATPFYSIFRWTGTDVLTSFQYWFALMLLINYTSCYHFLHWLFKNRYAAVVGAFVFAFSIALQSQMTHAQTFPRFCIPLAIWMTLLFIKELKPLYFFLSLLFLVWQFYCGIYLGFMLTIPLLFLYIITAIKERKALKKRIQELRWSLTILLSLVVNALLLMILMLPYYQRSQQMGKVEFDSVVESIPTIKSFFFSQPGSLLWDILSTVGSKLPASWDHQLFAGGIATLSILAVAVTYFFRKKRAALKSIFTSDLILLLVTGFLTFIFVVRIQSNSLYEILFHLPGFSSMRSLTRIINIELVFYAIAVSFVGILLFKRFSKFSTPLFLLLIALLTIDNFMIEGNAYRTEKKSATTRINLLKEKMKDIPSGSVVSYEPTIKTEPTYTYQLDAMLATQSMGLKSINGYSGSAPAGYHHFWNDMDEAARIKWFEATNFNPKKLYVIH